MAKKTLISGRQGTTISPRLEVARRKSAPSKANFALSLELMAKFEGQSA